MQAFSSGPFTYSPASRGVVLAGAAAHRWTVSYGSQQLGGALIEDSAGQDGIVSAFSDVISSFISAQREAHAPDELELIEQQSDERVARLAVASSAGMTPGLIDDRSRYWLRSKDRKRSRAVTLQEFGQVAGRHGAPPLHWICGLLPDDVLTNNPEEWRAPTSWEIRHIVGEGSFTGASGAKAAALVGVTPQNFRKYTARDEASTRQQMSFAIWHLLLHKLGVQRA